MTTAAEEPDSRAPDILHLVLTDGPAAGQTLPKPARFETALTIGRTKASKLHIKDPAVSEHHGLLRWTGSSWHLLDKDSSNGTKVNGERLEPNRAGRALKDGDVICFGTDSLARVELAPHADEDITVEQYFEAECHRLIQRIKARCEQNSNQLMAEWQTHKQQLEELIAT